MTAPCATPRTSSPGRRHSGVETEDLLHMTPEPSQTELRGIWKVSGTLLPRRTHRRLGARPSQVHGSATSPPCSSQDMTLFTQLVLLLEPPFPARHAHSLGRWWAGLATSKATGPVPEKHAGDAGLAHCPPSREAGQCKLDARGWASWRTAAHLLTHLCSPAVWAVRTALPLHPGGSSPGGQGAPSQETPLTRAWMPRFSHPQP